MYKKISNENLKAGDQIPTEKELMILYKTSRITASRAVRELENIGYVKRIKAKGTFVTHKSQWRDSKNSPGPAQKPIISVVFPAPSWRMSLEMEVLHGIESACRNYGYNFSIQCGDTGEPKEKPPRELEKTLITELMSQGSAGAVIYSYSTFDSPEVYNMMTCNSFPFVLLDHQVFGIEAPIVTSDNKTGFSSLVEYVIGKGHTKIAFVSGNTYESSSRSDRFQGYLKAMGNFRLKVEDRFIVHNLFPKDYNNSFYADIEGKNQILRNAVKTLLDKLLSLKDPPTVIMTSNDYIALNIMNVAHSLGINIPNDISLTGFDGLPIISLFTPRLTTIAQDFSLLGQTSITLLDKIIRNPQIKTGKSKIPTSLIHGESVKSI